MDKIFICCLLLGSVANMSQAQVLYSVAVSADQSELCEQVVEVKDKLALFTIHPNPAADFIQVSSAEAGNLHVYSITGSCALTLPVSTGTSTIDVRKLKPGLYILRLDAGNRQWHVRFVKE